jgi:hypothetical protein
MGRAGDTGSCVSPWEGYRKIMWGGWECYNVRYGSIMWGTTEGG